MLGSAALCIAFLGLAWRLDGHCAGVSGSVLSGLESHPGDHYLRGCVGWGCDDPHEGATSGWPCCRPSAQPPDVSYPSSAHAMNSSTNHGGDPHPRLHYASSGCVVRGRRVAARQEHWATHSHAVTLRDVGSIGPPASHALRKRALVIIVPSSHAVGTCGAENGTLANHALVNPAVVRTVPVISRRESPNNDQEIRVSASYARAIPAWVSHDSESREPDCCAVERSLGEGANHATTMSRVAMANPEPARNGFASGRLHIGRCLGGPHRC